MNKSFFCIDAHTCGNPVRLIAEGAPELHGRNMSEKRMHFIRDYDWIRRALMFEPRGHDMMSGSILYPPSEKENDAAVLFVETSGCLPMCGHGAIGTVTIALENGLIVPKKRGEVRLEVPAGLVTAYYEEKDQKIRSVRIKNVKSFLVAENIATDSSYLGSLNVDVAYGGNFYAIVDPQEHFPGLEHFKAEELIAMSRGLRAALNEQYTFVHPEDETIHGISHIMWTGKPTNALATARNAVFYGDKAIDRSPCGTGTSARMAQWWKKGKLKPGDRFVHESIIGSMFTGRIEEETLIGDIPAIVPSIEGWARVYGRNTITVDEEDDPYALGFQVI